MSKTVLVITDRKLSFPEEYMIKVSFAEAKKALLNNEKKIEVYVVDAFLEKKNTERQLEFAQNQILQVIQVVAEAAEHAKENRWASIIVLLPAEEKRSAEYRFLQGFLKSFACELAAENVILNAIAIKDRKSSKEQAACAQGIAFLSSENAYTTAQTFSFSVDNGYSEKETEQDVVYLTGGGQGIGLGIALLLAEKYRVFVNDIHFSESAMKKMKQAGIDWGIADISDRSAVQNQIAQIAKKYGRIDIFIGNAAFMKMGPVTAGDFAGIQKHLDINLQGHLSCLSHILPLMERQQRGKIILFSSMFGILGWKNAAGYAATKAAMIGLTQQLHDCYAKKGITATAIAPGVIDTPQLQADAQDAGVTVSEMKRRYTQEIPLGRIGKPEEIAYLVKFLCEGGCSLLSGQVVQANGGECRGTLE